MSPVLQLRPEQPAKIAALVPGSHPSRVHMAKNLTCAKTSFPDALNPCFESPEGKILDENTLHIDECLNFLHKELVLGPILEECFLVF